MKRIGFDVRALDAVTALYCPKAIAAETRKMRYVIVGAGALGGAIGAKLTEAGSIVALVARGEHLEALRTTGLRLRTPEDPAGTTQRIPSFPTVSAVEPPIGADDVVILAVKVHQAPPVLSELAATTAGNTPAIVCCTNGLDGERQALRHFDRVYAMLPCMFATHLTPGEVEMFGHRGEHTRPAWLDVGVYPQGVDALSDTIADDLTRAGFAADSKPDVMEYKRGKMLMNLGNATVAMSDSQGEAGRAIMAAATAECIAAYTAAGLAFVPMKEVAAPWIQLIGGSPDAIKIEGATDYMGSSWQSLAKNSVRKAHTHTYRHASG